MIIVSDIIQHFPSPVITSAAFEEQLRNIKVVKSAERCSFEVIFMECMALMCSSHLLFPPLSELIRLHLSKSIQESLNKTFKCNLMVTEAQYQI